MYYSTKYPLQIVYSSLAPPITSKKFTQASKVPKWCATMQEEFQTLKSNLTWKLCPRPSHRNAIANKWIYKVNQREDDTIERFKARLVARGYKQYDGIDFIENFIPIIKTSTIWIILAIAIHFYWPINQLDVSNTFLHGSLEEEVYME